MTVGASTELSRNSHMSATRNVKNKIRVPWQALTRPSPVELQFCLPPDRSLSLRPLPGHLCQPSTMPRRQFQIPSTDSYPCAVLCATLCRYVPCHCARRHSMLPRHHYRHLRRAIGRFERGLRQDRRTLPVPAGGWPERTGPTRAAECRPCRT